jgi:biopolymer transport protein ExbD
MKVDLPRAERVELALKDDGGAYWNGVAMGPEQLRQRLQQAGRGTPVPQLHLAADREVPMDGWRKSCPRRRGRG